MACRAEHHFVGEQLLTVHAGQVAAVHVMHEPDDEIAGAGAGIEDVNFGVGEVFSEIGAEESGHGGAHELDDALRGVDDAVSVGDLDGEAAEEVLVYAVEELLLVGEAEEGAGGGASMTRSTSTAMTLRRVFSKMMLERG